MSEERYVLATGAEGAERLKVVQGVHGADTADFFRRLGSLQGKRIVDIGCGIGSISCWLAEEVGEAGEVVGIDQSEGQIEQARQRAESLGLKNVQFHVATAYETGLERESFDIAYARFVLMHLREPNTALTEMMALLKPGGTLAVEDGDFSSLGTYPASRVFDRAVELYRKAGEAQGEHFEIGKYLHQLVITAGAHNVQARLVQPAYLSGIEKRLPSWTVEEATPFLTQAGIASQEEITEILGEGRRLEEDETVLFFMARMTQVWGVK